LCKHLLGKYFIERRIKAKLSKYFNGKNKKQHKKKDVLFAWLGLIRISLLHFITSKSAKPWRSMRRPC